MIYLTSEKKPIKILLVAENENTIRNVWTEFQRAQLGNSVCVVENAQQALDFLFHKGVYQSTKHADPDLILLSSKLSDSNGMEVFNSIKENTQLSHIPTIFLGSSNPNKILGWVGKVSYIPKPFKYADFLNKLKIIGMQCTKTRDFSNLFAIKKAKSGNHTDEQEKQ